jgi:hypothetical protein
VTIAAGWTASTDWAHTGNVALPSGPHSNRQWFVDRRAPDRRLQVTWHREHRTAVLSIWHGETCAATFQLPTDAAARLIAHLADGLAGIAGEVARPVEETPTSRDYRARFRRQSGRPRAALRRWIERRVAQAPAEENRSRKPRS